MEAVFTSPDGIYADGTVGTGGHSESLCRRLSPQGLLVGLDRDEGAIRVSSERLFPLGKQVHLVKACFSRLDQVLKGLGIECVNGVLLDLGMSSYQLEGSGRGFSFSRDEPLDMRMDVEDEVTARQLVNTLSARELEKILKTYGEESEARAISRAIERERSRAPVDSSLSLARLVERAVGKPQRHRGKHPATRTFQALRIAVNNELENLQAVLEKIPSLLVPGGRLVVLSYHSLEDRAIKQAMIDWERGCRCPPGFPECRCGRAPLFRRLYRKGVKPTLEETEENPRARSAVLRAAERI